MRLIFGAAWTPGSLLIRLATFSRWSHVGIVLGSVVVEARFPRVRTVGLDEFKANYPTWELAELPCADEGRAAAWALGRVGRLYDIGGLIGIPFQRDWQSNNRDFCSEMPVLAAAEGGTHYFRDDLKHRVTPGQLYAITRKDA